jgi:hypothetical protein
MDQKQLYTAPEVEPLVIRFEGMICQSPGGSAPGFDGYDDESFD